MYAAEVVNKKCMKRIYLLRQTFGRKSRKLESKARKSYVG